MHFILSYVNYSALVSFFRMCHLCAILNGIAGIVVFSAPSAVSSAWFPPNERTTATGIALVFNNLGNAFSFLAAPGIVPDPTIGGGSGLEGIVPEIGQVEGNDSCPKLPPEESDFIKSRISILMYFGKSI